MKPWPKVTLGEVLQHRKEFITINDLTTYKRPRVQLQVQGIVQRDEVLGALISASMPKPPPSSLLSSPSTRTKP